MDPNNIRRTIEDLAAEEQAIHEAMQRAEVRLAQLKAARDVLSAIESEEPLVFEGKLADAIRTVMRANLGRSLSPLEVRERLIALGYPVDNHDNVMAAIHGVLKRMDDSHELKTKQAKDGSGTRYYFELPLPPGSVAVQGVPPRTMVASSAAQKLADVLLSKPKK